MPDRAPGAGQQPPVSGGPVSGPPVCGSAISTASCRRRRPSCRGGSIPGGHYREPAERQRRHEHDHDAEAGEEADLLQHRPGRHRRPECPPPAGPPSGRRSGRRPRTRRPRAPRARTRARPPAGSRLSSTTRPPASATTPGRTSSHIRPEVAPGPVGRVGVVEVRADERNQRAPDAKQHQQHTAERTPAPPDAKRPSHHDHSLGRRGGMDACARAATRETASIIHSCGNEPTPATAGNGRVRHHAIVAAHVRDAISWP